MPSPHELELAHWNVMMDSFDVESDRGGAVLAGSFTENYLGLYLEELLVNKRVSKDLFSSMGPLASFSQRISIAYGFGFITEEHYSDLQIVRRIRNHFAHHPLEASFASKEVVALADRLSTVKVAEESQPRDDVEKYKRAYMFACSFFCGYAHTKLRFRNPSPRREDA